MPRQKRPMTVNSVIFNVMFILAYPVIALFTFLYTVLVWIFSVPSRIFVFFASKTKQDKVTDDMQEKNDLHS
jgi:hypothetical protein